MAAWETDSIYYGKKVEKAGPVNFSVIPGPL